MARPESAMQPNPTALRALVKEEEVDEHRSVLCSGYDDCLDAVLRESWRSWTCRRCQLFEFARRGSIRAWDCESRTSV